MPKNKNTFLSNETPQYAYNYFPVVEVEEIYKNNIRHEIVVIYRCITCMKKHENKSFEELRLEDYNTGRKGSKFKFEGFNFDTTTRTFNGELNESGKLGTDHTKFVPNMDLHTWFKDGVQQYMSFRSQCITCMEEYKGKSFEELRLEDYTNDPKGRNSQLSESQKDSKYKDFVEGSCFFKQMYLKMSESFVENNQSVKPPSGMNFCYPVPSMETQLSDDQKMESTQKDKEPDTSKEEYKILNERVEISNLSKSALKKETEYTTSNRRNREKISKLKRSTNETFDVEIHKSERDGLYKDNLSFGAGFGLGLVVGIILCQLIYYTVLSN